MRTVLCAAALTVASFAMSGEALAAVNSDRFGGFEDCLSYGEGAGRSAPAARDVYEALVVCQAPSTKRRGPPVSLRNRRVQNEEGENPVQLTRNEQHELQEEADEANRQCQVVQIVRSCSAPRAASNTASGSLSNTPQRTSNNTPPSGSNVAYGSLQNTPPPAAPAQLVWTGTYTCCGSIVFQVTGSGGSLTASFTGKTPDGSSETGGTWSNCKVQGNVADCTATQTHTDADKTGFVTSHVHLTLSCGSIDDTSTVQSDPAWNWLHGDQGYKSQLHQGAVFHDTLQRQGGGTC